MRRTFGVALLAGVAAAVGVAGPVAALLAWTLVGTPLTAIAGSATTFTLTATNLDLAGELGCLEVILPSGWSEVSTGEVEPSTGRDDWVASAAGTTVVVHSTSGGGRLETGQWVTFTIRARPDGAGVSTWPNHAHQRQDCTGADETGLPIAVTVLPAPTPTPAPTAPPTPKATPSPTPAPTPKPTSVATARPTSTPRPTPEPTSAASSAPDASPRPSPATSPRPTTSPSAEGPPGGPPGAGDPPSGGTDVAGPVTADAPRVVLAGYRADEIEVALGPLGVVGGVDTWIVPAATMGVPGVLILVWIGLQAIGAFAWIPAVRRLRDDDEKVSGA